MSNHPTAAFPQPMGSETTEGNQGMTMRQYYAAKAMQSLIAPYDTRFSRYNLAEIPKEAFAIADAMIAAESDEPEIEAVKAERTDWLECASDMDSICAEMQEHGHDLSEYMTGFLAKIRARYRQTDANY